MTSGDSHIGVYIPQTDKSSHSREDSLESRSQQSWMPAPWLCLPVPLSLILTHFYHCLVSFFSSAENIMQGQSNERVLKHLQILKDEEPSRSTALISAVLYSTMLFVSHPFIAKSWIETASENIQERPYNRDNSCHLSFVSWVNMALKYTFVMWCLTHQDFFSLRAEASFNNVLKLKKPIFCVLRWAWPVNTDSQQHLLFICR